jgi:TolB-like protein
VHVYRIPIAEKARTKSPLPLPDKRSLAVLPFQNMTGDDEQDYVVDGIVEEITTAISRLPWQRAIRLSPLGSAALGVLWRPRLGPFGRRSI